MKGNTPNLIKKMIDDVEAAQADVRSGKPELMLHGFAALIAITSEQAAMLTENYPEDRRMREFLNGQIAEMKKSHGLVAERLERDQEAEKRRALWREEAAKREAERKQREKERRALEHREAKFLSAIADEERLREEAARADAEARQGKLFDL